MENKDDTYDGRCKCKDENAILPKDYTDLFRKNEKNSAFCSCKDKNAVMNDEGFCQCNKFFKKSKTGSCSILNQE